MVNSYDKVVKRLVEYRKRLGWSQEKMCRKLNLSQSYYSRLESGRNVISYEALELLMQCDCDIDLLITGYERRETVLDLLFQQCITEKRAEFLIYMAWVIRNGAELDLSDCFQEIDILQYKLENKEKKNSVWERIRRSYGLTQEKMAEVLDINIKKYREIEKCNRTADAMILLNLYNRLHYHPTLLFEQYESYMQIFNHIWLELPQDCCNRMVRMIKTGLGYLNCTDKDNVKEKTGY